MKKAVVTGANGFVGSALCRELVKNNVNVTAIVRNHKSNISEISNLDNISIVYCELSEYIKLPQIVLDRGFDVFYHFAWEGSSGELRGNDKVQMDNIKYTCDAVRISSELGCKKFVFAGSIMEYEIHTLMQKEMCPNVKTLYCSAKLAADYMARTIAASKGIDYVCAVISNAYGPGEISMRLINTTIRKFLSGEHCAFSAGEQIYDFIYIVDAAKALLAVGELGRANKIYYIGSMNPKPLKEFLMELRDIVSPGTEIGLGELPFEGVSLSYKEFDIEAVKNDTGFIPKVSFEEGIQKTMYWLKGKS